MLPVPEAGDCMELLPLYFVHYCAGPSETVVRIQVVTGGTDQTSEECSLGQTIPI